MTFEPGKSGNPAGKWKPGQSGNPKGRPPRGPFDAALQRLRAKQAEVDDNIAMALAAKAQIGDVAAVKEWADRSDGKLPTSIGGTDELPELKAIVRTIVDPRNTDQ